MRFTVREHVTLLMLPSDNRKLFARRDVRIDGTAVYSHGTKGLETVKSSAWAIL